MTDDELCQWIKGYTLTAGFPPTVREIGMHLGLKSPATVHKRLRRLQKIGRITQVPHKPRTIIVRDGNGAAPVA